mmetsp:Transcript_27325/g.58498  ORF Transcript_27325/g.58498 Transcript_27325/m.58498 type:complete len:510 (+) Transcript_27325:109-1638(+)|eukprot:CAMPEP_0172301850 /NCGR_PEP_ID=MMETSP1058-20130122/3672_1 /TAXON_ID=83371 /ORGANISM="Detonula confervacea, Strain CCMP 353" /LENGTH=509 /DNA_ID=CAMNT_0013012137 /DNA_START=51 /DNA_END=1580 /DNA_ORIENTATION=+
MSTASIAKPTPSGCPSPSTSSSNSGDGVSPQIGSTPVPAPSAAPYSDRVLPSVPKLEAASANEAVKATAVVPNPLGAPGSVHRTSLEALLNAKQSTIARVEAKFNEKILMSHQRLLDEQKRVLEDRNPDAKDHSLAIEVKRLREGIEEQKFSHEVELAFEKNRVKQLEVDLKQEKERKGATASTTFELELDVKSVVKKLEDELQTEKHLRIEQLKSLEMLHFAEFREIEKKHAEFVSHLVASYQNEIKVLKNELKMDHSIKVNEKSSTQQECECSEAAAAAAALSSLSAPYFANELSSPTSATEDENSSVTGPIQMPPLLPTSNDWDQALNKRKGVGHKKMNSTHKSCTGKNHKTLKRKKFKRDVSEVSDSGSVSEEPKGPSKRPKTGQQEEVEEILRKAGITPPVKKHVPIKKNSEKKKNLLADHVKEYLKEWMMHPDHCEHPYPTPGEKATIMADTGMSFTELNNWFVNNRKRFWQNEVKPKIEEIKNAHRLREMKWSYEALIKSSV